MLGKLFKYDMKQISRIMLPLVLLTFGTTLFGTAALKTVNEVVVSMESGVAQNVLLSSLYMVFGISVFVLCAFAVMAILFTVARFYKNLFTDEGYLTFTLPVNTSTIIMSKFWATVLWMAIASVAIVVCIFIYVSFGNAPHGEFFNTAFYKDLGEMLKIVMSKLELSDAMFLSEAVVCVILQVVHSVFMLFLAVTIGSIVAKKHKILASVGFYYIINSIVSTIMTAFTMICVTNSVEVEDPYIALQVVFVSGIVFFAILSIAEFLIINAFLKKKLNLQ